MYSDSDDYDYYYDYDCSRSRRNEYKYDPDDTDEDREFFKDNITLARLHQEYFADVPNNGGNSRFRMLYVSNNNDETYGWFHPSIQFCNILQPRIQKKYVNLFLMTDLYETEKCYPSEEEKELIDHYVEINKQDDDFLKRCFVWAMHYELKTKIDKYIDFITDVNEVGFIIEVFKNNDVNVVHKLINHPKFNNFEGAFRFGCIHSNNWEIIQLFFPKQNNNNFNEIVNLGLSEAMRCGNLNVVKHLIEHATFDWNTLITMSINTRAPSIIELVLCRANDINVDHEFIRQISACEYNRFSVGGELINITLNTMEKINIEESECNSLLITMMRAIVKYCSDEDADILIRLINFKKNTITEYNELFRYIFTDNLYHPLESFLQLYKIIPIEYNFINDSIKELISSIICYDLTIFKSIIETVGTFSRVHYEKITKTLLKNTLEHLCMNRLEILVYVTKKCPSMLTIIDEYQEKILYTYYHHADLKTWVTKFPPNENSVLNTLKDAEYHINRKILPLIPYPSELVFECITKKILNAYNDYIETQTDDFYKNLHLLITKSKLTEHQCIKLADIIIDTIEYEGAHDAIELLRLKIFDFEGAKINYRTYRKNIPFDYEIKMEWCMRQYLVHNTSPTVIWKYILTNMYVDYGKNSMVCSTLCNVLNKDIFLIISTMLQLCEFWECATRNMKTNDAYLELFVEDYEIVIGRKKGFFCVNMW